MTKRYEEPYEYKLSGTVFEVIERLKKLKQYKNARLDYTWYPCGCYHSCQCPGQRLVLSYDYEIIK